MSRLFDHYIVGGDALYGLSATVWRGQTFTVATTFRASFVRLLVRRNGAGLPGIMTASIRATSAGLPTGADLVAGTIDGDALAVADLDWRDFVFPTPLLLTAGVQYAICVRASSGPQDSSWQADSTGPTFAGGTFVNSFDTGVTWALFDTDDFMFEVWGDAIGGGIQDPGGSFTRRMSGGRGGFLSYITPDGRTYPFHTPHHIGRWVISYSGFGTPPIEYITERGPFQHGATVRDYFLRPRVIQLLIRQAFCDRVAWWGGRADLLNEIRPNRQATPTGVEPGELQLVETDGTIRSLNVFIQEGPRFEPRESGQWDEWAFQEVLRFVAYDPVAFDPTQVVAAFPVAVGADLVFPITFPIQFGSGVLDETLNVTYPSTWQSFPIITIVGPIQLPRLDNVTTGEKIEFSIDVAPGRTVTIDLTEGNKTVVDDLGNNLIGGVTPDSDLGTFHIAPDPEAPLGVNVLRLRGTNATGATAVSLAYFERYFGF